MAGKTEETKEQRLARRLAAVLDKALNCIAGIRYTEWPTKGLGVGASPGQMDEVLQEGESVLNTAKRYGVWRKT
jgi:hypothetical protein